MEEGGPGEQIEVDGGWTWRALVRVPSNLRTLLMMLRELGVWDEIRLVTKSNVRGGEVSLMRGDVV